MLHILYRCIDHSMHCAAYHFIQALGISSILRKRKKKDGNEADNNEDNNSNDDDEADIDISIDIKASANDPEAMQATTIVDFDPGDTLGKLLVLVNQVQMSSKGVRECLAHACAMHGVTPIELRLWVHTCWGSLSDCLEVVLRVQKVCLFSIF